MENKVRRLQITLYVISALAAIASAFAAGRFTAVQDADCPFDFEQMDITPQTPTAYHHIGHRAPKHGIAVPLPPRRPTI
jgi:hypothetical protein